MLPEAQVQCFLTSPRSTKHDTVNTISEHDVTTLQHAVNEFIRLLINGQPLEAMERFYDQEVVVFENRQLARAGRDACLKQERAQLAKQPQPVLFRLLRSAVDEENGCAFLEYVVRFVGPEGRPMRIEQVAVQTWSQGKIIQERFYYEGVVDEGDEATTEGPA